VWIITTALADQFLAVVTEPDSLDDDSRLADERGHDRRELIANSAPDGQLGTLVTCAGEIARIVNYYDGPKTPRSLEGWPSLGDAVAELHLGLTNVARARGVKLDEAVAGKLRAIALRDSRRFARAEHDPSTAPCLEQFRAAAVKAWGSQFATARLWGAPSWSAQPLAANVAAIVPTLSSFTRAAARERLDGYVVAGPALASEQAADDWATAVLGALDAEDARAARDPSGEPLSVSVLATPCPYVLLAFSAGERQDRAR
jgi:hypothetical protein